MSYTIEYDRKCFKLPKGSNDIKGNARWEDDFYLFIKSGSNNIHPRPKDWHLYASGWNYVIVQEVCKRAGYTEGGGIKLNDRDTTPENYLKLYRKCIADAEELTLEGLQKLGINNFTLYIPKQIVKPLADFQEAQLKEIKEKFQPGGDFLGEYDKYYLPLTSADDLQVWLCFHYITETAGGFNSIDQE